MKKLIFLVLIIQWLSVFGRMPTEYNCDVLRQHGILTPKCKARYIVHEGREPLVISDSDDDDRNVIESKEKLKPLPIRRKETRIIDSTDCKNDNNDGNWLLNLFNNMYRQVVVCDAFKLKQPIKTPSMDIVDFNLNEEKREIRRSPVRKGQIPKVQKPQPLKTSALEIDFNLDEQKLKEKQLPSFKTSNIVDFSLDEEEPVIVSSAARQLPKIEPKSLKTPSLEIVDFKLGEKNPGIHKMPKIKSQKKNAIHSKIKPTSLLKPKKGQLNDRYRNVETINWRDPLLEFHAVEQQKRINKKLQIQPKSLARSKFHSRTL